MIRPGAAAVTSASSRRAPSPAPLAPAMTAEIAARLRRQEQDVVDWESTDYHHGAQKSCSDRTRFSVELSRIARRPKFAVIYPRAPWLPRNSPPNRQYGSPFRRSIYSRPVRAFSRGWSTTHLQELP